MSYIVEMVGLPGAGKSTLACAFLAEASKNGSGWCSNERAVVRCLRRRDDGLLGNLLKRLPSRVWEPLAGSRRALAELHAFASDHSSLFSLIFEALRSESVSPTLRQCVLYALVQHTAERQLLDVGLLDGECVLVEEGLAMGLLALLDCLPPDVSADDVIARFVCFMPSLVGLVWVDVEPSECVARLRRRPVLPLAWAECSDRELLDVLIRRRCSLEVAFEACGRRGIPCKRIENSECDTKSLEGLCDQLRAWTHQAEVR